MADSDIAHAPPELRIAARRAYERGRLQGALLRGGAAALLALPGLAVCQRTPFATACFAGFVLVVIAGHFRGESFGEGARAGALAGILPCLLPAAIGAMDPSACMLLMSTKGLWICAIGGGAAGVILGLGGARTPRGFPFWGPAVAALAFAAVIGCLPAGALGFAGLAAGLLAGGVPALALRKALA
jgi:hypothetical protein